MRFFTYLAVSVFMLASLSTAWAADPPKPATEDDFYKLIPFDIPEPLMLEIGGIQQMPDGKIAVSTRRGDIYMVENAFTDKSEEPKFHLWAGGLHEVLGLAYRDGWLYAVQRCEVTRIKDTDKDGRADLFETVSDGWEIDGDYHEYAFGSKFDKDGNLWVVLCLTGSFSSNNKYRGWCLRITPEGKVIPTCSGIRSPGGIGANAEGDMFYTDNQGPWNGTCGLKHLKPGTFQGHPDGNRWYKVTGGVMGPEPKQPLSGSRIVVEAKKIPEYMPPPILFPYGKMGNSASGVACDTTGGKFGPFEKQLFVGDQTASTVMRCYLEKVNGRYQGACFPWRSGISSGTLAIEITPDGSMFVGSTNRGWGSRGTKPHGLDRIVWTGKVPFEIHEMKARPDGFELTFTQEVDPATAADPKSYTMSSYCYIFQSAYGSPVVDEAKPQITKVTVGADKKSVRLVLDKVTEGHIHELHGDGLRSAAGQPLLHKQAYYTLNQIPSP